MRDRTPWPALTLLCALVVGAPALVSLSDSEKRPNKHPDYSAGFREFKLENWEETADHMTAALEDWKEDGELTRVYGRWFEPYLPHFYLGVALFEMGCYEVAMYHFKETILNDQEVKGAKKLKLQLELLKLESDEFLRQGAYGDSAVCGRWPEESNGEEGEDSSV